MNWLQRQMVGRYGNDQLNTALLVLSFAPMLIAMFSGWTLLMYLGYLPLVVCVWRTLSRNIEKRRLENNKFAKFMGPVYSFFKKMIRDTKDRKVHKYYLCPNCRQRLRLPRGKGEITIRCPKCNTKFTGKT